MPSGRYLDTGVINQILTRVMSPRIFRVFAERVYRRPWVFAGIVVLLLILAVDSGKVLREGQASFRSRSDFEDYYEAAKRLRSGEDLYLQDQMDRVFSDAARLSSLSADEIAALLARLKGVGAYLYPPFFAWALGPLAQRNYADAAVIYQVLSLVALVGFFLTAFLFMRSTAKEEAFAAHGQNRQGMTVQIAGSLALSAWLYIGFLDENAANGNAGFFLVFLSGVGLLLSFRESREGLVAVAGGFLIGLAAAIKIIPGFLAGVLFAGRRPLALAGFFLGLLCAFLAPALTLGWDRNLAYHTDWYTFLIQTYSKFSVVRPYANNQTISAALSKLFIGGSDIKQGVFGLPFALFDGNPVAVSMLIRLGNLAFTAMLACTVFLVALRRPVRDLYDPALARLTSVTLLTALVASGVSWYHTYALMVIPLCLRLVLRQPMDIWDRLGMLLPALSGMMLLALPRILFEALSVYSLFTWIVLISILIQHRQILTELFRKSEWKERHA